MPSPVLCKPTKHVNSLSYFSCGPFLAHSSVTFSSLAAPGISLTDQKHLCKNVLIRVMAFKDLLMPLWKNCVIIFSANSADGSFAVCSPLLLASGNNIVDFFSKCIQIFVIIEIGFCAPKIYICYLSVHSFRYLASPEFGCRGDALSWEYQLDPVPGFSLQVDIAVQAENRDWECCPLQRCSSWLIAMPKISEERPLLQWILFSSSGTTAAAFYIQPTPYECKQVGFCSFTLRRHIRLLL